MNNKYITKSLRRPKNHFLSDQNISFDNPEKPLNYSF